MAPEAVPTRFERDTDQAAAENCCARVARTCESPLKPRDINLDELIATAIDDPQAMGDRLYRETDSPAIRPQIRVRVCV